MAASRARSSSGVITSAVRPRLSGRCRRYTTTSPQWFEGGQANASEATSAYMSDPSQTFQAFRLDGEVAGDSVHSIYVAYDENFEPVTYTLPAPSTGRAWFLACDTSAALASSGYCVAPGSELPVSNGTYTGAGRSAAIFIER
jgi:hypothetical protein